MLPTIVSFGAEIRRKQALGYPSVPGSHPGSQEDSQAKGRSPPRPRHLPDGWGAALVPGQAAGQPGSQAAMGSPAAQAGSQAAGQPGSRGRPQAATGSRGQPGSQTSSRAVGQPRRQHMVSWSIAVDTSLATRWVRYRS